MTNFLFRKYPKYKWALAFNDLLVLNASFLLALEIRYFFKPDSQFVHQYIIDNSLKAGVFVYSVLCIFYFQYSNMYKIHSIFKNALHVFLIMKSIFFIVMGFILFHFFFFYVELHSKAFFGIWFLTLSVLMLVSRIPFVSVVSRSAFVRDRVVIIGTGQRARRIHNMFRNKIKFKEVIGFLGDHSLSATIDGIPVLGIVDNAERIMKKNSIDYFVLAEDDMQRERFFEIFQEFQHKKLPLYVSSQYVRTLYERLNLDRYGDFGLVRFNSQFNNKLFLYMKRVFDIVFSTIAILVFSPLLIAIALIVKATSRGNVIYKQIRIGKHGKPFYFYKFRSMYLDGARDNDRQKRMESFIKGDFVSDDGSTKIVNKARVTPVGAFLRKYSLDELPQLFNVLFGNMSLVGPRPCIVSEWKIYEDWQKQRLDFVPGCTGVWQVCGRSEVNFEENVLMDIYYNQNYSIWFDLKIMLKTVYVVLSGKGGG